MSFSFLGLFLAFVIFLAIRYRMNNKKQQETEDSFWAREATANSVPTADLDSLQYITIPLDKFPLGFSKDPEITALETELQELADKRLLNLTGKTNTELKEAYGVANLATMQAIGEDFDRLTVILKEYAEGLIAQSQLTDAIRVLEFGVAIGTDISQNYTLLGDCYQALGQTDKIGYLMTQVENRHLLLGPSIIRHLQSLLSGDTDTEVNAPEDFSV